MSEPKRRVTAVVRSSHSQDDVGGVYISGYGRQVLARERLRRRRIRARNRALRRLGIALVLSLFIHSAILPFLHLPARPKDSLERLSQTEKITISKKVVRPKVAAGSPHAAPLATTQHPTIALVPPAPATVRTPRPVVVRPVPVAHGHAPVITPEPRPPAQNASAPKHVALAQKPSHRGPEHLTASQVAGIESDLAQSLNNIRRTRGELASASQTVAVAPAKHFGGSLSTGGDIRNGRGLCDPIQSWQSDGFDYYYVACNVQFSDGTFERQPVPWPVRFPPDDDPFNGSSPRKQQPLAAPLPGWHLSAGQYVSKELRQYAHDQGVDI